MVARTTRPTDLLALALFARRGCCNEAKARRDFAQQSCPTTPMPDLVRQWLFTGARRLTCLSSDGTRVLGLASARRKAGQSAWEVDRLLLPRESRSVQTCTDLLSHLVSDGGEHGVHRIFLRLFDDSELIPAAQQAGFFPYKSETLFLMSRRDVEIAPAALPDEWAVRPKSPADHMALFRLYSAAVPVSVREAEALTLQEWLANRDGADGSRFRRELVGETNAEVRAWLQSVVVGGHQHMDLLCHPNTGPGLRALVETGLRQPNGMPLVYWLVPDYLEEAQSTLRASGCLEVCRFKSMARQLAVRTRRSFLIPASARTAYSDI